MALSTTQAELLKSLNAYLAQVNADGYEVGLFKNNATINSSTVIGDLTPCDFGGYDGTHVIGSWSSATWVSPRAEATAAPSTWTADGTSANSVYGYYVIDNFGALAWAEKVAGGPITIGSAGQIYIVVPKYTRRSEF